MPERPCAWPAGCTAPGVHLIWWRDAEMRTGRTRACDEHAEALRQERIDAGCSLIGPVQPQADRDIETDAGWPTGHEMVTQLREALGMFTGAMPRPPQEVWEEALAEVRRLRERVGV